MSPTLDSHGIAVLTLAALALFLFTREGVRLETSALIVLAALALGFQLFPYERPGVHFYPMDVLAGFGNEALLTIVALLGCSRALEATGALTPVSHVLARIWRERPQSAFLAALVLSGLLSMFVNNTPVVAMMLPLLIGVCRRAGVSPAGVLMPIGYATIVGGMATTIGTSTNLLVVGVASDAGVGPFGMFHFTPIVLVAYVAAILFLWLVAPRLLPDRTPPLADGAPRLFDAVLCVREGCPSAGLTLAAIRERTGHLIRIAAIERGQGLELMRLPWVVTRPGDRLHVRDTAANLKEFERVLGVDLVHTATPQPGSPGGPPPERLAEIVVTRGSPFFGCRLDALPRLLGQDLTAVAVHRPRVPLRPDPEDGEAWSSGRARLQASDTVLVQGTADAINALKDRRDTIVIDGTLELPDERRATRATAIMTGVIVSVALGLIPISVAATMGLSAMLITRCLTWRQFFDAFDIRLVLIIVASLALGQAMTVTGGTAWLASEFVAAVEGLPSAVIVSGLMLAMALVTEIVTNNAAAVLGTPIALEIADGLGSDREPLVLAVLFGANMSYLTPIGYQTNLLVFSAGGYHFRDFIRVGLPLQLIVWAVLSVMLALIY